MKTGRIFWAAMVGFAMTLPASMASAQLNSGAQTIALNAKLSRIADPHPFGEHGELHAERR